MSIECFIQAELEYNVEKVGTSQKSISRKPLTCNILYKTKKIGKKKSFGNYFLYLLKLLKMTYGTLSKSGIGQFGIEYYISIHI